MTDPRPCPACGAPLSIEDTHWSLFPEPMGGYVCPVAPAEGLDDLWSLCDRGCKNADQHAAHPLAPADAAHVWVGDHGVADGGNIPPAPAEGHVHVWVTSFGTGATEEHCATCGPSVNRAVPTTPADGLRNAADRVVDDPIAALHATTDAMVWTEEFFRLYPDGCRDADTMLGWFANAIETGRTAAPAEGPSLDSEKVTSKSTAPAEGLDAVPCYDQHTAGIDEHWHAIPTRSGFSCIVCGERLLEERQFCAKCEPSWRHPAAPAEGLREALNVLLIEIDVHGLCECVPPYPRGDRHAPECDVDDGLRAAIDRLRAALEGADRG